MTRPHTPQSPPSPSDLEPPPKFFKSDGPFGTRTLPPPSLPPSLPSDSSARTSISHDFKTPILNFHRPHSISTPDSGQYASPSTQSLEDAKPRSHSYPINLVSSTSRLYSVSRPSIDHPKYVFELSEEQKQQPPSQPIAQSRQGIFYKNQAYHCSNVSLTESACVPCRKKKVGCDLRQPGNRASPPCNRCRADNVRCFFSAPTNLSSPSNSSAIAAATSSVLASPSTIINITDTSIIPNEFGEPAGSTRTLIGPNGQALPSLRDLACPHCSLVFLRDDDLRLHLRTQCPEKHYVCTTCHARFKRLNDLDRHCRIHTGERPHKCEICRRTFSRATTLTRHKQGPEGCAGRRADIGRRRLGSFQGPPPEPVTESTDGLDTVEEEKEDVLLENEEKDREDSNDERGPDHNEPDKGLEGQQPKQNQKAHNDVEKKMQDLTAKVLQVHQTTSLAAEELIGQKTPVSSETAQVL